MQFVASQILILVPNRVGNLLIPQLLEGRLVTLGPLTQDMFLNYVDGWNNPRQYSRRAFVVISEADTHLYRVHLSRIN